MIADEHGQIGPARFNALRLTHKSLQLNRPVAYLPAEFASIDRMPPTSLWLAGDCAFPHACSVAIANWRWRYRLAWPRSGQIRVDHFRFLARITAVAQNAPSQTERPFVGSLRKSLATLREGHSELANHVSELFGELELFKAELGVRELKLREEHAALIDRCQKIEAERDALRQATNDQTQISDQLSASAAQLDAARAKLAAVEQELAVCREEAAQRADQLSAAKNEAAALRQQFAVAAEKFEEQLRLQKEAAAASIVEPSAKQHQLEEQIRHFSGEMKELRRELEETSAELEQAWRERDEALSLRKEVQDELEQAHSDIESLQASLAAPSPNACDGVSTEQLTSIQHDLEKAKAALAQRERAIAERESEIATLHREVDHGHARIAQLASVAVDHDQMLADLEEARGEAHRLRERLVDGMQDIDAQRQIHELEADRAALEEELETVRQRAAEMAETLVEQKRQMAEERAEWNGELRQLRKILERQSEQLGNRGITMATPAVRKEQPPPVKPAPVRPVTPQRSTTAATRSTTATPRDAVMGSVMAQFEMLQQDRLKRRNAGKS